MIKLKLNCYDRSDKMRSITKIKQDSDVIDRTIRFMMKMRQDNDVTNRPSMLYTENETELS